MLLVSLHSFSGIAASVLTAWRAAFPGLVQYYDVSARERGLLNRLRCAPLAVRRGGPSLLLTRGGRFWTTVDSSAERIIDLEERSRRLREETPFDFALVLSTTFPGYALGRPYFVYTDHPILANRYFPGGEERVSYWQGCLPHERRNLEGATRVFAMSSHAAQALLEEYGLPTENVVRVNAGCNSPAPTAVEPDRYFRQRVLFVGVDWDRKGGPELLEAFRMVRRELPGARLTVVGCSPRIREAGVEVVGQVPPDRVAQQYARASLFCMPSRREPFGIVYLEALRAGLPVVSLDLGAAPDFVIEGETGYRAPVGDVPALAARLLALLRNPEMCRRFGDAGRRLVESQYTWEGTQQAMWRSIEDALSPR